MFLRHWLKARHDLPALPSRARTSAGVPGNPACWLEQIKGLASSGYAVLSERKLAFEWLDRAKAEHDPFLIYVQTDPNFDSLRDDSELVTLLK